MVAEDLDDGETLAAVLPHLQDARHVSRMYGDAAAARALGKQLHEGYIVEALARRLCADRHRHRAAQIHLRMAHGGQHPYVRLLALQHVRVHRSVVAGHDDGFDLLGNGLGEDLAELVARFARRQAERIGTALAGRPHVADNRKLRRLAVRVERLVEFHHREFPSILQVLEDRGHIEIHGIHGAANRSELLRIVADRIQVGG